MKALRSENCSQIYLLNVNYSYNVTKCDIPLHGKNVSYSENSRSKLNQQANSMF